MMRKELARGWVKRTRVLLNTRGPESMLCPLSVVKSPPKLSQTNGKHRLDKGGNGLTSPCPAAEGFHESQPLSPRKCVDGLFLESSIGLSLARSRE